MTDNARKRKQISHLPPAAKRPRFTGKPQHNIPTVDTNTAYPNGELNVSHFMRVHENEIKSLENAMKAAKKGLSRRAFQDVPRDLRRRTGSHNPQRVPKRLRTRARKEAKEDNTPILRNKSGSGIGKGKERWLRKEGIEKSKKARERRERRRKKDENKVTVTAESEKREQTPQLKSNTIDLEKSKNHKAKRKKLATLAKPATLPSRFRKRQVHKTWLPTHIWHAKRALITPPKEPLWRFAIPLAPVVKAYRLTHRAASLTGAMAWDMSYMSTIGLEGTEASVVGLLKGLRFANEDTEKLWQEKGIGKKWRDGTRAWAGWIHEREGKLSKKVAQVTVLWSAQASESQKRKVFIRVHPSAFLQLWNEVIRIAKVQKPAVIVEDLRFEIGSIEIIGPASAETLCSILRPITIDDQLPAFPEAIWPSLASVADIGVLPPNPIMAFNVSDPRLRDPSKTAPLHQDNVSQAQLTERLATWPLDKIHAAPEIFNRNSRLAAGRSLPSQQSINRRKSAAAPGQYPEPRPTDPQIPALIYVSKNSQSWTVLLPWQCVVPVWRCMMRYPISTGGNPRFGGLKERRQVSYERSKPEFPFDFPGTDAGWSWELQERLARKEEWTKRPRGKRIEWTSIDLGNGRKGEIGDPWACDWERIISESHQAEQKSAKKANQTISPFQQIHYQAASNLVAGRSLSVSYFSMPHVFTVKIAMVQRGVPTNCARIYRLPRKDPELRKKWLSLMPGSEHAVPKHPADRHIKARHEEYPVVPDEEDLIGFVTTGNYNLAEGKPTAIANLVLQRVLDEPNKGTSRKPVDKEGHVCIVREAGQSLGRLAGWEAV